MTEIIIISAVAANNVIGNKGRIPWHIPEDFARFRRLTMGFPVIMGRKTFESLPIKPLPKRTNIVLTRNPEFYYEGVVVKQSLADALEFCKKCGRVFICGGQSVYEEGMKIADTLEITRLEKEYAGDTFFPQIGGREWQLVGEDVQEGYSFQTFKRKRL